MADAAEAPNALLAGYSLGGLALRPLVPLLLAFRAARGKEDASRTTERYGRASRPRPEGPLVWVHAASVGETNAVLPLIARITAEGIAVLFTSTTVTSSKIAAARLPAGAIHQFGPIDIVPYVERFLDHWRPQLAILVESEIWPNVIGRLHRRQVPLVIVNARLSARSFEGWNRFPNAARRLFAQIGLCLAQSPEDANRYVALGASPVRDVGNLKFDVPPLAADEAWLIRLRTAIAGRPVWVAASTHDGEEAIVAAAHKLVRQRHPNALCVLVPRHPERGASIRESLMADGLNVTTRSRGEVIAAGTEIYLADTLNELGLFFRLSPVCFLGGSLIPQGGHNPIEPTQLGVAVLHGPHVHNFADLFALLDSEAPTPSVTDAESLAAAVSDLLAEPQRAAALAAAAGEALAPLSGALETTMTALAPYLGAKAVSA